MSTPFTCKPAQHTAIGGPFSMTYRPLITLILMLSLFITTPAVSANFQQGLDAYKNRDYVTALEQWWPLAEQGHAAAQYNLGNMYANGLGVPQDGKAAVKWFTLAAEQGHAKAQSNLGVMYATGRGVLQDYVRAHMWFNIAASNGVDSKNRDLIAKKMTPSQLEKAQNLAREWVTKHGG